jgi:DNA end-binding protein Ku
MPNVLWSGTLTFGLVSLPVAVVTAVRSRRSSFHLIHRKDNSRLRRKLYCPKDGKFVTPDQMLRGYEVEKGEYIIVSDEEIDSLAPRRSKSIEIQAFVGCSQIDPAYYDRPYYLVPTAAEKPYQLLVEMLAERDVAGVAELVMHARQHLCAVQSIDGALCLLKLRYPEKIRSGETLAPSVEPSGEQVKEIESAIKGAKMKLDPTKLKDEYQERIDELVKKKKRKHETVEVTELEEKEEEGEGGAEKGGRKKEGDLVSLLEESLAKEKAES